MNCKRPPVVFETLTARAPGESRARIADGDLANFLPGYRRDPIRRDAAINDGIAAPRAKVVDDGRFVEDLRHLVGLEPVAIRMRIAKARERHKRVPTGADSEIEAESD